MSAKPTGDGPGVEESNKNLDGATGGGRACYRDSYMYGSNEEAILDPYRLSLHLIAGFGEGITLQHAVDRLFDHLSTGFRPICVAESHRHQHHHRRPRRTRKPRTGYPPLHVQVFLMPKELGMSWRLLSRPPWRLRHWHLPPGAPQRGVRLYTLSDLPAPLWSVVEAQGGHPMLRFVVNASHDTFSAACRLYTELLLGGESRDLGLIGNEEAIRSIAALNNIAELNESMVDEKVAGNYSQEYTRRFTGLNAESKKKSNILDRQHDGQRNNRHGGRNSSTLMNDHVKACGQLNGVGKADGDGSDRRLTGDEGCRKSCGLSPSRDRTSQPSQDGGEWSRFASGFEGFSCMAVTVTPSLLVQLAVQRLPIGVQPGRSPCALLEVRVPGSELGRFVPLLPSSCQPISATRWQTRDHDGNKILLQTNSVPVQLGPEPWLSLPVDGADGDTICSLPTSPAPTPSLRPNCQSLPASPGPSLPCCSPALSPTHSPTRSPEQNTPCRCRPHSYISVSTHQSPPQSPTRNFISQKSSLSPPYQSLPHHSSNRAQLFSAHRRHHCSLTANRPTSPRLSTTYGGASHPSKLLHDPSSKRPSRQIISHLSCHGQPSANGQQQMENRTETCDKAPLSQQPGQAAGRNVLAENTLKEGQKEAEEQEFFI